MCQQAHGSKVLLLCCITVESKSMGIKLMEIKLWNRTNAKHIYFKTTDNKAKLGTLHFNNKKNTEDRCEVLEDIDVMDKFIVGDETQNVKDYLLALIAEDMRLFAAVE